MGPASVPIRLSQLTLSSGRSLESALRERRSVREYSGKPLTRDELAQLLWAAQGVTGPEGFRAAPSAGALYPLEVDVVVGDVDGLPSAIYRYKPDRHELVVSREGDRRRELRAAAHGQDCVGAAAAVIALAAVYERTSGKYGGRGVRYVHMEVGHAAQNVCLQATALGLGAVVVGAFEDGPLKRVLGLARDEEPLALLPVGRPLQADERGEQRTLAWEEGGRMDMCICGHSEREHGPTGACHAAGCRCKHFKPEIRVPSPPVSLP